MMPNQSSFILYCIVSVCTHLLVVITISMTKTLNKLCHTSTYVFTLTTNLAGLSVHVEAVCSQAYTHLCFLCWLREFDISTNILLLIYRATIERVIWYAWNNSLWKIVSSGQNMMLAHHKHFFKNSWLYSLSFTQEIFKQTLVQQAQTICSDVTLPSLTVTQNINCFPKENNTESQVQTEPFQVLFHSTLTISVKELNQYIWSQHPAQGIHS